MKLLYDWILKPDILRQKNLENVTLTEIEKKFVP